MEKVVFFISIINSPLHKLKERVNLGFNITQHSRDSNLIEYMVKYLGCGVVKSNKDSTQRFEVTKFSDLYGIIIPFFDKYPLIGVKLSNYLAFKEAVNIVINKEHLTLEGLNKIKEIKANKEL